ncbi:hypothetical protein [Sphingobacterium arenae]|nr:hypothetical protein [Sphingobacterium arenae]
MKNQRMCIYAKEVGTLLGKSPQQARRILSLIKDSLGKKQHQYVSIHEFATYTGLNEEEVRKACQG